MAAAPAAAPPPAPVRLSSREVLQAATDTLAAACPKLRPLIEQHGLAERLIAKQTPAFRSLARAIVFQQLAGNAAAAIYARVLAACGAADEAGLTPEAVLRAPLPALRAAGLSERKASYVLDLARRFADSSLSDELLLRLGGGGGGGEEGGDAAALMEKLTAVKGIGPWSVHMFELFHLGKSDTLPTGDLGVRKGIAALFGLPKEPTPAQMEQLTAHWRPYRSIGSFYMWRLDLPRAASGGNKAAKKAKTTAAGGQKGKRQPRQEQHEEEEAEAAAAAGRSSSSSGGGGGGGSGGRQPKRPRVGGVDVGVDDSQPAVADAAPAPAPRSRSRASAVAARAWQQGSAVSSSVVDVGDGGGGDELPTPPKPWRPPAAAVAVAVAAAAVAAGKGPTTRRRLAMSGGGSSRTPTPRAQF